MFPIRMRPINLQQRVLDESGNVFLGEVYSGASELRRWNDSGEAI
jgi:hypothetical protein